MSSLGASIKMEFATVTRDQLHDAIQQMAYGSRFEHYKLAVQAIHEMQDKSLRDKKF